jgi:hypothetical protein
MGDSIENILNQLTLNESFSTNILDANEINTLVPNLINLSNSGRASVIRMNFPVEHSNISEGLLEEEIKLLHNYKVKKEKNTNCSICLEKYKIGDEIIKLDCGHEFHSGCLKHWLTTHKTCPICRFNIRDRFEDYKKLITKLASIQLVINMIPYILLHNDITEEGEDDEVENNNGVYGWLSWGFKHLSSYFF